MKGAMMARMTMSSRLEAALSLPNGARFYRCALQVNPFQYLVRHSKQGRFKDEAEYNAAIISACLKEKIEVLGITDQYRVKHSSSLVQAARSAGLWAFNGFEAVTKDGVHFLCLFDPEKDHVLERFIGECGVHSDDDLSPTGNKDTEGLLACAKGWGGICIAAHVAADGGGLLKKLSGKTRVNAWTSKDLLAAALAGPIEGAQENLKAILKNENAEYRRQRPVAIINASDVNMPEDLKKEGASCYIKMSAVSVEALRQAFLDPESPSPEHRSSAGTAYGVGCGDVGRRFLGGNRDPFQRKPECSRGRERDRQVYND
jgi:hypothetical protein